MPEKVVILMTSTPQTLVEVAQRRLDDVLNSKKIACEKIDGCMPENKSERDNLFSISNERGKYPQCFIRQDDGSLKFVGLWETIESLLECDTLPGVPADQTFNGVFANVQRME